MPIAIPEAPQWVGFLGLALSALLFLTGVIFTVRERTRLELLPKRQSESAWPDRNSILRKAFERTFATLGFGQSLGGGSKPDVPLWHAVQYVARQIGDDNAVADYPDAVFQVIEAARNGLITIWGRAEKNQDGRGMQTPIPASHWENGRRINSAGRKPLEDWQVHSYAYPVTIPPPRDRYFALKVIQSEIERQWPKEK